MAQLRGKDRSDYVRSMFDRIAARYNLMNRLITAGQDQKWRRAAVEAAQLPRSGALLDLATGTGDIAFAALERHPDASITGADFALNMMRVGQRQEAYGGEVGWTGADALRLPFADGSFDAVISAYLMRNVIDMPGALREQWRVLKAGGRIVILDTSPPPQNLLRPLILLHLRVGIPLLGRIVAGRGAADAYRYLPESTKAFKTPQELASLTRAARFGDVRFKTFMFGTMALLWAVKIGE